MWEGGCGQQDRGPAPGQTCQQAAHRQLLPNLPRQPLGALDGPATQHGAVSIGLVLRVNVCNRTQGREKQWVRFIIESAGTGGGGLSLLATSSAPQCSTSRGQRSAWIRLNPCRAGPNMHRAGSTTRGRAHAAAVQFAPVPLAPGPAPMCCQPSSITSRRAGVPPAARWRSPSSRPLGFTPAAGRRRVWILKG